MKAVIRIIRILVTIQLIENIRCQNFGDGNILRYFSFGNSEEQVEPVTGYSANFLSKDANSQAVASLNLPQYQVTEELEQPDEYSRADYARTKKVFRIKNPFQQQSESNQQVESNPSQHDSSQGASNQYSSAQYSLPPDDYIQKMKADNQYYQQQLSTPSPNTGFAATPLPQYQFSTVSTSNYDSNNQQSNQIQFDPKISHSQNFFSNANNYQYSTPNTFSAENVQSTPSPYSPTSLPNSNYQFVGTASNPYASSSLPLFLSSPQNIQGYISSPYSQTTIQSASSDYNNNRGSSTAGSNSESYDKNDVNKRMQVEYYDNSVNGVKYPFQQYQNEYQPTTPAPTSSPYNAGVNALSKSLQELSLSQLQNFAFPNNQQDLRSDGSADNFNSDTQNTHRAGNFPSSNVYVNYIQQDYQNQNIKKNRHQEAAQETGPTEHYSNGDFGWKLGSKKATQNFDAYSNENIKTYHPSQSGSEAISQVSFHMDTEKNHNYDQIPKGTSENVEIQSAIGKQQERIKQQQQYSDNNYHTFIKNNQQPQSAALAGNGFQDNEDNQRSKYHENSNIFSFGNNQLDLVTASPTYNFNSREVNSERTNSFFDHAKALKAILPIDVSNAAGNSEFQGKNSGFDGSSRFNIFNFNKDQSDQSPKQYNRPIADAYYKDKNSIYGFNIKTKPEDYINSENFKQYEQNTPLFSRQQQTLDLSQNIPINFASVSPSLSYNSQQDAQISQSSQQGQHRFQNQVPSDIGVFKVNDSPYRFTQGLSSDNFRLNNNNFEQNGIPTSIAGRINQNLNSHQLDTPSSILNKYVTNKPSSIPFGRPDSEGFGGVLSTINGFKVANPFNVDMKLVADVLKGKPTVDETHLLPFRDQFNKASPPRLDLSQLQLLLKNENIGNSGPFNDGISSISSPFFEPYNGRFPYQGVKYSRSQEEEENIPITDTGSNPFIGAVIDQDNSQNESELRNVPAEVTAQDEENITIVNFDEEKPKKVIPPRIVSDRYRHPNTIGPARHPFHRKYPRTNGPYPLLKLPPFNKSRNRISHGKMESLNRKRRLNKPPTLRIVMTEPVFEVDSFSESEDAHIPILLRPPPQIAQDKSDKAPVKPSS